MGYATNPFNSNKGKEILKQNFRLVFAAAKKNPRDIEATDLRGITSFFVDNTEQIINNIMKFSKGYRPIEPANAFETGIYVCPHCLRRDFVNLWEFEYLGYYQPGSISDKSLKFQKYRKGKGFKRDRYVTIARVKCNKVYSCDSCYTTHVSKPSNCNRCGEGDFTVVGCESVSYAEHFTPSLTVKQLFSNPQEDRVHTVNENMHYTSANISKTEQIVKPVLVMPTAFEYSKSRYNKLINRTDYPRYGDDDEYENFMLEIPNITVAYSNKKLMVPNSTNCVAKPKVSQYPICPMRILRWKAPSRFICNAYSHRDYSDRGWRADFKLGKNLGTSFWCSTTDMYGRQHGARFSRRRLGLDNSMVPTITSPNPLPLNAIQPKLYQESRIYKITLEMRPRKYQDETFQYSLYLPEKYSLQPFMKDITEIPLNQGGTEFCPNDPTVDELLKKINCDKLNKNDEFNVDTHLDKNITVQDLIDDGRTDVVDIITKYAAGIVTGPVGSFSQMSLEGCSERGVLMKDQYKGWVDYSSEVLNAAGDLVPRYLFVNRREQVAREWLAKYCKKLNEFGQGRYTFMNFGMTGYNRRSRDIADHLFSPQFVSKTHEEEQLLPVLAGTPCSISTSTGNEAVFSKEFWRKLRGVKLKSASAKTTFIPIVTDGESSFISTNFVSNIRLPICTLNGGVTKLVSKAQKKARATHTIDQGVQYLDDSIMTIYTVMRCGTCDDIFNAGGVMAYRSSQGWVDSGTALVTGNPPFYTQQAFDTELAHEMAAGSEWEPFTTSDGFRVCPNWGIDDSNKYGKAMLKGATARSMDVGARGSGKRK